MVVLNYIEVMTRNKYELQKFRCCFDEKNLLFVFCDTS